MSDELKPCPWCASTNVATQPDEQQGTKWGYAYCVDCGIRGPEVRTSYKLTDDAPWRFEAIVAWNDRAQLSAQSAQVKEKAFPLHKDDVKLKESAVQPAAWTVDDLAQEIRRVDGNHSLGAGSLAEALMPFLARPADADAVDAKRYRYLKNMPPIDHCLLYIAFDAEDEMELDAAIDAAIAAQSTEGAKG